MVTDEQGIREEMSPRPKGPFRRGGRYQQIMGMLEGIKLFALTKPSPNDPKSLFFDLLLSSPTLRCLQGLLLQSWPPDLHCFPVPKDQHQSHLYFKWCKPVEKQSQHERNNKGS